MSRAAAAHPVALVVEDKAPTLERRRQLLVEHGFEAIGARNAAEALREFRAMPTIDIVVTDINLDPDNTADRSGVALAEAVRARRPTLPIVALSGHFDSLDSTEQSRFDDFVVKAGLNVRDIRRKLEAWHEKALEYRERRVSQARSELARLREQGALSEPAVEVLRDFIPVAQLPNDTEASSETREFETPDETLRRKGWRLRLVEAGFPMTATNVKTYVSVPFWIRQEEGVCVAVLHAHSCIYSDGDSEEECVSGALELMLGYAQEFDASPAADLTHELRELRGYLKKVFGAV